MDDWFNFAVLLLMVVIWVFLIAAWYWHPWLVTLIFPR